MMDEPDWDNIAEAFAEISNEDKQALWLAPSKGGVFTTAERDALKSDEFNAARKVMRRVYHREKGMKRRSIALLMA